MPEEVYEKMNEIDRQSNDGSNFVQNVIHVDNVDGESKCGPAYLTNEKLFNKSNNIVSFLMFSDINFQTPRMKDGQLTYDGFHTQVNSNGMIGYKKQNTFDKKNTQNFESGSMLADVPEDAVNENNG